MSARETSVDNTYLSKEELQHFKEKLLVEKREAEDEIRSLESNLSEVNKNFSERKSSQDHHQGDIATLEENRIRILSALERNREKLDQITVALDRIHTGNYGICIKTGRPIQKERLEAMPYALKAVQAKN
ncbi:MAG: TraR/DksA family transcriptional regulator [Balneolaceae bacterium]|nr:MAG: TraR/DksA family transcriptional regulator [Balneolaceae bacterium]